MIDNIPYYQINAGAGFILAIALSGIVFLMILLRPKVRLDRLAVVFMITMMFVMWPWQAAIFWPDIFGVKTSLIATFFFVIASLAAFIFATVAWFEYLGEALDDRYQGNTCWERAKCISSAIVNCDPVNAIRCFLRK